MRLYIGNKDENSIKVKKIEVVKTATNFQVDMTTPDYDENCTLVLTYEQLQNLSEKIKKTLEGGKI
jgi:hypothetical protein